MGKEGEHSRSNRRKEDTPLNNRKFVSADPSDELDNEAKRIAYEISGTVFSDPEVEKRLDQLPDDDQAAFYETLGAFAEHEAEKEVKKKRKRRSN